MRDIFGFPELKGLVKPSYWGQRRPVRKLAIRRKRVKKRIRPVTRMILSPRLMRRRKRRFFGRRKLTGIEMEHLRRIAGKHGIERDLFDFKAHIDRTLSYPEAKREITRKIRLIAPSRPRVRSIRTKWGELNVRAELGDPFARRRIIELSR